jgi:hypothetical protein
LHGFAHLDVPAGGKFAPNQIKNISGIAEMHQAYHNNSYTAGKGMLVMADSRVFGIKFRTWRKFPSRVSV